MTNEEGRPPRQRTGAQSKRTDRKVSTVSARRHYQPVTDAAVFVLFVAVLAALEVAACAIVWVVTGP